MERKYSKPAIREAVFECRFPADSDWDPTIPGLVFNKLRSKYPLKETRVMQEVQVTNVKDQIVQNVNAKILAVFLSEDRSRFIQVGPNLISVNVIAPYPTWQVFQPMIMETIEALESVISPIPVNRAGLRYINQFDFSTLVVELDDYFQFSFKKSNELPKHFAEFLIGGLFLVPGDRDICRIQLASAKTDPLNGSAISLDLDFSTRGDITLQYSDLPGWLENAHSKVIAYFENCIKDPIRELMGV